MLFVVDHVASYISIFTYWLVHCTPKISGTHLSVNVTGTGKQHQLETPCSKYKRINIFFQRQPFDCMWWKYSRAALISWIFQGTSDRRFSSLSGEQRKSWGLGGVPSLSYWVFYRRAQWFQFQLWHLARNMMQFGSQNCSISKHTFRAKLLGCTLSISAGNL